MRNKTLQILSVFAFVSVIVFNYLAATGQLNNISTATISAEYPTQITPAGYAFTIWSLIYFGLLIFTVLQALPSNSSKHLFVTLRPAFILNCAANCAWLAAWQYELIGISVILMFTLLVSLAWISSKVSDVSTAGELLFVRAPFNLYFGWITLAAIINVSVFLVSSGVSTDSVFGTVAAVVLIVVAAALGTIVRFGLGAFSFAMAGAWGITAIAVKQSANTPVVVASAVAVIVLLFVALWGVVKD